MARARRLLMVCTANICRSPMAEGWARHVSERSGTPAEVRSGGIMGLVDRPADPLAIKVMGELGVDLSGHRSSGISEEDLRWADHALVMELRHRTFLLERHPWAIDKVMLLGQFGGQHELDDPVGGWRWRFRRSRDELVRCVDGYLALAPSPPDD
jgi:protein-tyrosine phosphatase